MNLRQKFEKTVNESVEMIRSMPWEDKNFYNQWLAQQYFLVSHTPRLLCAFALRIPIEAKTEFAEIMYHLKEETGHDLWLLSDIKKMGHTPEDFTTIPCANSLIKSQYYQIQHDEPMSLCGYSQYLEYLSAIVAGELADRIEKKHGKNTAVFLRGHSNVDVAHSEDGWKMINKATPKQIPKIIENLEMTSQLYLQMLREIQVFTSLKKTQAA